MYDDRLGRWMSTDPHQGAYPSISPYSAFYNNPNVFIDKDGRDNIIYLVDLSVGKSALSLDVSASDLQTAVDAIMGKDKVQVVILKPEEFKKTKLDGSDVVIAYGEFAVTLGVAKINNNFDITPTWGKASMTNNSWDIFIASWGRSVFYYYEPIIGRMDCYRVYKITYVNTTGAIMFGNRRVIVEAGEQFFPSVPVLDFNIKIIDSTWQFKKAPLEFGDVGVDASSD